jgi:hypothetical protein
LPCVLTFFSGLAGAEPMASVGEPVLLRSASSISGSKLRHLLRTRHLHVRRA